MLLTNFVDYLLRENTNRWRGQEVFLGLTKIMGSRRLTGTVVMVLNKETGIVGK